MYLKIQNTYGSIQHFGHFMLGFLVPLIYERNKLKDEKIIIKSSDVLDHLIEEFKFPNVEITKEVFVPDKIIKGYDEPRDFNKKIFREVRELVLEWFKIDNFDNTNKKILLINRSLPDPFYFTDKSDYPTLSSGTDRRSIPNFQEVASSIKNKYDHVVIETSLKDKSLVEQIQLFRSADLIIGQVGADLHNLLWAKDGAAVINIFPKTLGDEFSEIMKAKEEYDWNRRYYPHFCRCMGVRHFFFDQQSNHSKIEIEPLMLLINDIFQTL